MQLYKSYIQHIDITDKILFYNYIHLDCNGNNISHITIYNIIILLKQIICLNDLTIKENEIFNKQLLKILLFVYKKGTIEYQNIYNKVLNTTLIINTTILR